MKDSGIKHLTTPNFYLSGEPAMTLDRDWLTLAQAAEYLQVSPFTVLRWIKAKKLPAKQLNGRKSPWRIKANDLEDFLKRK